jgi:hypothetical protein
MIAFEGSAPHHAMSSAPASFDVFPPVDDLAAPGERKRDIVALRQRCRSGARHGEMPGRGAGALVGAATTPRAGRLLERQPKL